MYVTGHGAFTVHTISRIRCHYLSHRVRISFCYSAAHEHFEYTFRIWHSRCSTVSIALHLSVHIAAFISHMSSVPKLINAVVLLILLTALSDPEQYHLTSAELANDLDVMDDASK